LICWSIIFFISHFSFFSMRMICDFEFSSRECQNSNKETWKIEWIASYFSDSLSLYAYMLIFFNILNDFNCLWSIFFLNKAYECLYFAEALCLSSESLQSYDEHYNTLLTALLLAFIVSLDVFWYFIVILLTS